MSRLIDADALIMALRLEYPMIPMFKESHKEWEEKTEGYRKAEEIISEAPTIDAVEVVRGEWLPFEYGDDTWHKCSVCGIADKYKGSMPRPNGTIAEWEYVRNYCPNCGAEMDGERKESE